MESYQVGKIQHSIEQDRYLQQQDQPVLTEFKLNQNSYVKNSQHFVNHPKKWMCARRGRRCQLSLRALKGRGNPERGVRSMTRS
jgi:hypothetical protein